MLAQQQLPARIVVIADESLLRDRARALNLAFDVSRHGAAATAFSVLHVPLAQPVQPGTLNPANSAYVLRTLEIAADGCRDGRFDAMVTAPVHKGIINDAGIAFTGHTEFLAARTRA